MVASRRLRKRSTSACPQLPPYVGLLEPLQLTLQSSARDSKHPLFILHVQRRSNSSGSVDSWSLSCPFEAFEILHKQLKMALQYGHFCNAGCPWLFSFLSTEFPKKHIFQRSSSSRTVEARRKKLLRLLTSTLDFLLNKKNHACNIATTNVAKLFAEFLYGTDAVAQYVIKLESETKSLMNNSRRKSLRVLIGDEELAGNNLTDNNGQLSGLVICGVCNGPVAYRVKGNSRVSPLNAGRRRQSSVYATTLQCGHQFHDECIVPVLNETLRCPTCYHLEIQ